MSRRARPRLIAMDTFNMCHPSCESVSSLSTSNKPYIFPIVFDEFQALSLTSPPVSHAPGRTTAHENRAFYNISCTSSDFQGSTQSGHQLDHAVLYPISVELIYQFVTSSLPEIEVELL